MVNSILGRKCTKLVQYHIKNPHKHSHKSFKQFFQSGNPRYLVQYIVQKANLEMCHTRYEIQVSRMLKLNYIKINNEPIKSLDPGSNKVECPYKTHILRH